MDVREFLEARLAEDEAWARAASTPYRYAAPGSTPPEDGVHWTWVVGEDWTPVKVDPVGEDTVGGPEHYGYHVNLASVEEWPDKTYPTRPMAHTIANYMMEVESAAAGHIVRHDPARVLRDVEAKRLILARHTPEEQWVGPKEASTLYAVWCTGCWDGNCVTDYDMTCSQENWPCPEVRALASVWSDHPDYDPSWSPQAAS